MSYMVLPLAGLLQRNIFCPSVCPIRPHKSRMAACREFNKNNKQTHLTAVNPS